MECEETTVTSMYCVAEISPEVSMLTSEHQPIWSHEATWYRH